MLSRVTSQAPGSSVQLQHANARQPVAVAASGRERVKHLQRSHEPPPHASSATLTQHLRHIQHVVIRGHRRAAAAVDGGGGEAVWIGGVHEFFEAGGHCDEVCGCSAAAGGGGEGGSEGGLGEGAGFVEGGCERWGDVMMEGGGGEVCAPFCSGFWVRGGECVVRARSHLVMRARSSGDESVSDRTFCARANRELFIAVWLSASRLI